MTKEIQKRKFSGIWIPATLWLDDSMPVMEKVFLVEINSLDNDDGCTASNQYMAKFFGLGDRQAREYVSRLEQKGLIRVELIGRNRRRITMTEKGNILMAVKRLPDGGKAPSADGGKAPHSNKEDSSKVRKEEGEAPEWTEVSEVIDLFKAVNPSWEQLFKNRTERAAMGRLIVKWGRPKMEEVISFLPKSNGKAYAPTITSPWELEKKLGALKAFFEKERSKGREKKIDLGVIKV